MKGSNLFTYTDPSSKQTLFLEFKGGSNLNLHVYIYKYSTNFVRNFAFLKRFRLASKFTNLCSYNSLHSIASTCSRCLNFEPCTSSSTVSHKIISWLITSRNSMIPILSIIRWHTEAAIKECTSIV